MSNDITFIDQDVTCEWVNMVMERLHKVETDNETMRKEIDHLKAYKAEAAYGISVGIQIRKCYSVSQLCINEEMIEHIHTRILDLVGKMGLKPSGTCEYNIPYKLMYFTPCDHSIDIQTAIEIAREIESISFKEQFSGQVLAFVITNSIDAYDAITGMIPSCWNNYV